MLISKANFFSQIVVVCRMLSRMRRLQRRSPCFPMLDCHNIRDCRVRKTSQQLCRLNPAHQMAFAAMCRPGSQAASTQFHLPPPGSTALTHCSTCSFSSCVVISKASHIILNSELLIVLFVFYFIFTFRFSCHGQT